jgi:hypothetical protein
VAQSLGYDLLSKILKKINMPTSDEVSTLIKSAVKKSIIDFAKKSLKKKAKFQILDLLIPKERKIRSIVGGLETSLGTTLWEPLAKALAAGNGFEVKNADLESPVNMPANLSNVLENIIADRNVGGEQYSALTSHEAIKNVCQSFLRSPITAFEKAPNGSGVDIWLVKDDVNYFFDVKTVQPNLSALKSCMKQVLTWYAYFYAGNPTGIAQSRIVFPYNPKPEKSFWDVVIGGGKPIEEDNEAWVGNQFWDFCSGVESTFEIIKNAFTELSESGELEEELNQLLNR